MLSIFATGYKYFAPKGLIIRVDKTIDTERCRSHGAIISKLATGYKYFDPKELTIRADKTIDIPRRPI